MNSLRLTINTQRLLTSFLLVGLLFSTGTARNAKNAASQRERESGPSSIGAAPIRIRNYALTTLSGQRAAGHAAKENRVKDSVAPGVLSRRVSRVPASIVHHPFAATGRPVSYLSLRLSRPGGRAPPASA
jgi:hypothetical protein